MIDLYYFPTPNTWKVSIMLEETGLDYRIVPVNILEGEQLKPDFLKISPNNRVPAIVDHDGPGGEISVFESGAILVYLAEKTGQFIPKTATGRIEVLEWLFWQVGGLGPMAGQANHFTSFMADNTQGVDRYVTESRRLYGVLDRRLAGREWIAGEYSIADMACWGWVWFHQMHRQTLDEFSEIARWFKAMSARPAVQRGKNAGLENVSDEQRRMYDGPYYQPS
jgi:GST-like protein